MSRQESAAWFTLQIDGSAPTRARESSNHPKSTEDHRSGISYKLSLNVFWIALSVTIHVALGVRDLRTLKRSQTQQETEFKDFVRAQTADKP